MEKYELKKLSQNEMQELNGGMVLPSPFMIEFTIGLVAGLLGY